MPLRFGATSRKDGDKMAANVMGREVDPSRKVVAGPIATTLAVPCWSSWKAAMCQETVERNHPSWDRLEMPAMKP